MSKSFLCFLLSSCVIAALAQQKSYRGDKVFRLFPATESQLGLIRQFQDAPSDQFDFWSEPVAVNEKVDIRIASESLSAFAGFMNASKIPHTVMVNDVQDLLDEVDAKSAAAARNRNNRIVNTYPTLDELNSWLLSLCTDHPTMTECGDVGASTENRVIKYIKLGKPSSTGAAKQKIWIEGTMHAREWLSTGTVIYVIDRLLNQYNSDPVSKRMLDTYDWYVVPVTNPDGYQYSQTRERLWRKTRSKQTTTCFGVDPNRNWDFKWGGSGASTNPCSDTYMGPSAFSEPEVKALADFILAKKDNTRVYFSIHSYSQLWLISYGFRPRPTDYNELLRVGDIGAKALMAVYKRTWRVGTIVDLLYEASGVSQDWAKAVAGIKYTYCLELRPSSGGMGGFVQPTTEIDPSGREVWAGLIAAIDAIPN